MQLKLKYRRILVIAFVINIFVLLVFLYLGIKNKIPNEIKMLVSTEEDFDFNIPIQAEIDTDNIGVLSVNHEKIPSNGITIDLNKPFTISSHVTGQYSVNLKLFGLISIKEVSINVIDTVEVLPCGNPIGIYVKTDGILVLGSGTIKGLDGLSYEPSINKLKSGDYILSVNNIEVSSKSNLIDEIQNCNGKSVNLKVRRNDEIFSVKIQPVKSVDNIYKIGAWIREDTQGIGTLTFVTNTGEFGALGHGITDIDTGLLMEICKGTLYEADIMSVIKGKEGTPGELIGVIHQNNQNKLGEINQNTNQGIFGKILPTCKAFSQKRGMTVGLKQEVKRGKATILCYVDHKIEEYEIEILSADISNINMSKGMVIKITDEELLKKTGGIVQGMSGSPIIQNNKLIGAVTHVFIQDSTKGYGTFIENMLNKLE